MADGTAWRLVSQCATVEDVVRVFRTLASTDGLTGIPISGIGPGGGSQVRLVLALSTKASVLDGDAVVTRDAGTVSVRWTRLDPRGRGLLAHMVEHRTADAPPAVPRHLIPLGAAAGTPATARGDATMAKCVFEPMGATPRAGLGGGGGVPDLASTVRSGGRPPAAPTVREKGPPAAMAETPARAKREMQKTLMGMPTMSAARAKSASTPPPAAPAIVGPQPSSGATTMPVRSAGVSPAVSVVPTGTPPGGLAESVPVPKGGAELKETGPTQPTRGGRAVSPAVAAAAHAIAATPAPFDNVPTVPTAAPRRTDAAPSGPVDELPTVPNEDIVTDVSVALPDLPSGDYVDPIIEPPVPPSRDGHAGLGETGVPAMVHAPAPASPPPVVYAVAGPSPGWPMPPQQVPMYPPAAQMVMPTMPPPQPYYPTPYPVAVALPGGAPMMISRDDDMTEMVQLMRTSGRRRWPVIAVTSGVIVVGIVAMVVVAASGGGGASKTNPGTSPAPAKAPAPPPPPSAQLPETAGSEVETGSAAAAVAPQVEEVRADCKVAFTSSPDAAEVVLDGRVLGKTPFDHVGSCGAYKVSFRREKYQTVAKEVAAGAASLEVRLERPQFKLKVTSRPSGAVVKVGGVDMGKTPATIKLPGHESTTLELVKNGVTTTHRVFPDKNDEKVDVKLKPRRR